MRTTIVSRIILLAILILIGVAAFGQTARTARPDTFRQSGNVLLNDFDPQGDKLKCVRFNNFTIKDSFVIKKKDTGTFILKKDGTFKAIPLLKFNGRVAFTYHMTDGKGGANSKGTIVYYKELIVACSPFTVDLSTNDSCRVSKQNRFWVKVQYAGDSYYGYTVSDTVRMEGASTVGTVIERRVEVYYLRLFDSRGHHMIRIDPSTFLEIEQYACPE
jgi:hypothetical protein